MQRFSTARRHGDPLRDALRRVWPSLAAVAALSALVNALALTGWFYFLVIYDRVLVERSVSQLVVLSLLAACLYAIHGALDFLRSRASSRGGASFEEALRAQVFEAIRFLPLGGRDGLQPVRDLDQIRAFLAGAAPAALLDLLWVPVHLLLICSLNGALGLFAAGGAGALVTLIALADARIARAHAAAGRSGAARVLCAGSLLRHAEVAGAMSPGPRLASRWEEASRVHSSLQLQAADAAGACAAAVKSLRLIVQTGLVGLGALLVMRGQASVGTMMAASIILSRALGPIEAMGGHWRTLVSARESYRRLGALFDALADVQPVSSAPAHLLSDPHARPSREIVVDGLAVSPQGGKPVLSGVSFRLAAGDGLAIVGPTGGGKSALARALAGIWPPAAGIISLDGATLDRGSREAMGRCIGYLPQHGRLILGTVAENIARFEASAAPGEIVAAAKAAGAHDLIERLPKGYETVVGEGGASFSAGERRQIALARALFGAPFLVVLDEPDCNLDGRGLAALTAAMGSVRRRGGMVIAVAHRAAVIGGLNKVLVLAQGRARAFGFKHDVVRDLEGLGRARRVHDPCATDAAGAVRA